MSEETKNLQQEEKEQDVNALRQIRVEKLEAMQEAGNDPFQITTACQTHTNAEITAQFEALEAEVAAMPEDERPEQVKIEDVSICGRIMTWRDMGKANFIDVRDISGRMQVYVKVDEIGEENFAAFKKWDIGDIVEVKGVGSVEVELDVD